MNDHDTISEFPAAPAADLVAEVLNAEPSPYYVRSIGSLVETSLFTTTALKAFAAFIADEFEATEQAELIRSILPAFAALEAKGL